MDRELTTLAAAVGVHVALSFAHGAVLVTASAIDGLVFEGLLSFVLATPDHVAHVTRALIAFLVTPVLTTAGDASAAIVAGGRRWRTTR